MKPRNSNEESLKIPSDILLDVLRVVAKESLSHEVTQVIESRGLVFLSLYLNNNNTPKHQRALQNIQNILEEYNEYRYSENQESNWRD